MTSYKLESKKAALRDVESKIVDENGYYKILAGAINTYNRAGIFYRHKNPTALLTGPTILNRRVTEGTLISESEHPDYTGMNAKQQVKRTVFLDTKNKVGHIKAAEFVDTGKCEQGWNGYNITEVYIWFKPSGPYGETVKEALDNSDENVYFSVRSLVRETFVGSIRVRDIVDISTWDYVYEGGIKTASQWNAIGVEGIDTCIDGLCGADIESMVAGNESMTCDDGKCLMRLVSNNKVKSNPIMNW